jgi:cysteinyl-tRNA synthetase
VKALKRLRSALRPALPMDGWSDKNLNEQTGRAKEIFLASMDDDFNTAGALGHLFDLVKAINQARDEGADQDSLETAQTVVRELTRILGLELDIIEVKPNDPKINIDILQNLSDSISQLDKNEANDILPAEIYSGDIAPVIDIEPIIPELELLDNQYIIEMAIKLRNKSRDEKDWTSSDLIRDVLSSNGIILEDTAQGTTWHWK